MNFAPELRQAISALLDETTTLTLATLDPGGGPRATPLYFVYDHELRLTFLSEASTQHCLNLAADPRAAVAVYPEESDWRRLRGLQMRGRVAALVNHDREQALATYRSRFPFVEALSEVVDSSQPYRFAPDWIRYLDNRRGFGFKQEVQLS